MSARAGAGVAASAKPDAAAVGAAEPEEVTATAALVRTCWDAIAVKLGHAGAATPATDDVGGRCVRPARPLEGLRPHTRAMASHASVPAFSSCSTARVPLFVTIKKRTKAGKYELRGCIGSLTPRPLADLRRFALKSAFEDRRFDPLEAHELEHLEVSISLLVAYEEASGPDDWIVGLHGIIIVFSVEGDEFTATYLPEVAAEMR